MPYRVPTLDQWLKDTAAFGRIRSKELKEIDAKIADFHRTNGLNKPGLQRSLQAWQQKEGVQKWADSPHNKSGAISDLDAYLNPHLLTQREKEGFDAVREAQRTNFNRLFRGAQFRKRGETIADEASERADDVAEITNIVLGEIVDLKGYDSFKEGFTTVATAKSPSSYPSQVVMDIVKKIASDIEPSEVVPAIGPSVLKGFYASLTPFLGPIKAAGGGLVSLGQAIYDEVKSVRTVNATSAAIDGAPALALLAVSQLLDSRAVDNAAKGTAKLVEGIVNGALQASGVAAVASSAVTLTSKVATLAIIIRRRVVEYKEIKAGGALLAQPDSLGLSAFQVCPLLGCYLLAQSNHSDIVISCFSKGKMPGGDWKIEVERNMDKLRPCISTAKEFINDYLYELSGGGFVRKPGETLRAAAVDKRPWAERFWISHWGATKGYYRVKNFDQKIAKAQKMANYVTDPVHTFLKKDVKLFVDKLDSGKSTAA